LLESLATLYTKGAAIDWAGFDRPYARRRVALPTYPFQRERHWVKHAPMTPISPPSSQERAASGVDDLAYQIAWTPRPREAAHRSSAPLGRRDVVVVLADKTGLGETLAQRWRQQGADCVTVTPGSSLERDGASARADPSSPHQFVRLLDDL